MTDLPNGKKFQKLPENESIFTERVKRWRKEREAFVKGLESNPTTKPTQDKETLREAVARVIDACDPDRIDHALCLRQADAAIATMFKRLRDLVPAIYEGPDQFLRKADVLAAFQQENSDAD